MFGSSQVQDAAGSHVGKVFKEKWRLDALIGIGGMAAVYAATHRNGSRVAIKVLHRHLCASEKQVRRFLNEAYTANRVGHAGAVAVYDDDIEGNDAFLVMELLTGTTLKDYARARGGRLSVGETLRVVDEVLDVLKEAHMRGIVHRDIKPGNLFVSSNGDLKVLDFGVARCLASVPDVQSTFEGDLLGTPAFMAPEQARGRHELVDARSDIWSVGATIFTLLSGELVHPGSTATEHLGQAMSTAARSLRSVRPDLPARLIEIVDRCLHYEPEQRFADAVSLQVALRASDPESADRPPAITQSEITPLPIATLASTTPPAQLHTRPLLLPAAGALALVTAALVGSVQFGNPEIQHESSAGSSRRAQISELMKGKVSRSSAALASRSWLSAQSQAAGAPPVTQPTLVTSSSVAVDHGDTPRSRPQLAVSSLPAHVKPVAARALGAVSGNPLDQRH